MILNSSVGLKRRKLENDAGEPIYPLGDIDTWSNLYQKQDDLEKLRLYFTLVAWSVICKVYPKHEMIVKYDNILRSPEFMQHKLLKSAQAIDDISDSMALLGSIPQYHLLGNEQNPGSSVYMDRILGPVVKTEPGI